MNLRKAPGGGVLTCAVFSYLSAVSSVSQLRNTSRPRLRVAAQPPSHLEANVPVTKNTELHRVLSGTSV